MQCITYELTCITTSMIWGTTALLLVKYNKKLIIVSISGFFSVLTRSFRLFTDTCGQHIHHILFYADEAFATLSFVIFLVSKVAYKLYLVLILFVFVFARFLEDNEYIDWGWECQTLGHIMLTHYMILLYFDFKQKETRLNEITSQDHEACLRTLDSKNSLTECHPI